MILFKYKTDEKKVKMKALQLLRSWWDQYKRPEWGILKEFLNCVSIFLIFCITYDDEIGPEV